MGWSIGDRVRHVVKPDWGLGEVLGLDGDGRIVVYFERAGEKLLKDPPMVAATGAEAQRPLVRGSKSRALKARQPDKSLAQYREAFVALFPKGFRDPEFVRRERDYKVAASKEMSEALGQRRFSALLSRAKYGEACREALKAVNATNLIYPNEKMDLRDGLRTSASMKRFSETLYEWLHGKENEAERFQRFVDTLDAIGASKWTTASYFAFLAIPRQHMFLKPVPTKRIADACGMELNYRPEPNWLTYESLRQVSARLELDLKDLSPRDFIDVQSFIWCVAR